MIILLFIWCCAVYGFTSILVESVIANKFRTIIRSMLAWVSLRSPLDCMLCTSVWVAIGFSYFIFSPTYVAYPELGMGLRSIFTDAMMASTIIWFLHVIEGNLSKR